MFTDVCFSINDYDQDGDCHDSGIFLHFGDTRIKAANNMAEFEGFIEHLESMRDEIKENYPSMT